MAQVNLGFLPAGSYDDNGVYTTNDEIWESEARSQFIRDNNPPSARFNLADYLPKSSDTTSIIGGLLAVLIVVELLSKRKK